MIIPSGAPVSRLGGLRRRRNSGSFSKMSSAFPAAADRARTPSAGALALLRGLLLLCPAHS
jgi:hypothetical protein